VTEEIALIASKIEQGGAKLTAANGRQGKRLRGVENRRVDGTQLTPKKATRRYKPRARKCANKACQKVFTPDAKHGRFCSDACRKVEARRRAKKGIKVQIASPDLELVSCLHCTNTFFRKVGSSAKYCSDSHKELAYRQRKEATISAISDATGMGLKDAAQLVRSAGMPNCTRWLKQQGMEYNDSLRRWLMPMGVSVDVGQGDHG
jgi:hypothetical protein